MNTTFIRSAQVTFLALLCALSIAVPFLVAAQATADTELQATIRAMLLSDPRTSSMTSAQIDAMVVALSGQAQKEGITSEDIEWRPEASALSATDSETTPSSVCGSMPAFLCAINVAFGFAGDALLIPLILGLTSGLLILILGIMLERHHLHVKAMQAAATVNAQ